jgi:hypothetical protein
MLKLRIHYSWHEQVELRSSTLVQRKALNLNRKVGIAQLQFHMINTRIQN